MNPFGTSRTVTARDHALFAPDSHVGGPLFGWGSTRAVTLISPTLGARFHQALVFLDAGAVVTPQKPDDRECLLYVLEGTLNAKTATACPALQTGGYLYLPPGQTAQLTASETCRLLLIERRYQTLSNTVLPEIVFGQEQDVEGKSFLGDPDARLKTLLPETPAYDMAVNIFTFQPGAALPFVESHVMEHGLLMLQGAGVYRLSQSWYPVEAGDTIWMASYCPQWFAAFGKTPARYIYYKDVQRDPLEAAL